IMELPTYHLPQLKNVSFQTWNRSIAFVKKAGTIILVSCVLIWFTSNFSFTLQQVSEDKSILAAFGRLLAPIFAPLGWGHWKGAVAAITGLIAKENVIGTFGILYGQLGEVSENGREVWTALQADFSQVGAYSYLVFNLLCAPCFAAMGAIHREMGDVKWTLRAIGYQCGLAYAVSLVIYQFGSIIFENGSFSVVTVMSAVVLAGLIYYLVRKHKTDTSILQMENISLAKEGK